MNTLKELQVGLEEYKKVIVQVDEDIKRAEKYREDFVNKYDRVQDRSLSDAVTCSSMVLKVQDYLTQKRNDLVQLKRQKADIEAAIEEVMEKTE